MHIRQWIVRAMSWMLLSVLIPVVFVPIINPNGNKIDEQGFDMLGSACVLLAVIVCAVLAWGQIQSLVYFNQLIRLLAIIVAKDGHADINVGPLTRMIVDLHGITIRVTVKEADALDDKVFVITSKTFEAYRDTMSGVSVPVLSDGSMGEGSIQSQLKGYDADLKQEMAKLSSALIQHLFK